MPYGTQKEINEVITPNIDIEAYQDTGPLTTWFVEESAWRRTKMYLDTAAAQNCELDDA